MDESLQLLPAVEILDLSRNKFAKVDNLLKCTKLKHLDLGFNHLRTIAPLSEVQIINDLCDFEILIPFFELQYYLLVSYLLYLFCF